MFTENRFRDPWSVSLIVYLATVIGTKLFAPCAPDYFGHLGELRAEVAARRAAVR